MQLTFVPYTIVQYKLGYIYMHIRIKPKSTYRCSTMYMQHIHSYILQAQLNLNTYKHTMQLTFVPCTCVQYMLDYIYVHIKFKPEPTYRYSTMYTQYIHSYSSITITGLAKTNATQCNSHIYNNMVYIRLSLHLCRYINI